MFLRQLLYSGEIINDLDHWHNVYVFIKIQTLQYCLTLVSLKPEVRQELGFLSEIKANPFISSDKSNIRKYP